MSICCLLFFKNRQFDFVIIYACNASKYNKVPPHNIIGCSDLCERVVKSRFYEELLLFQMFLVVFFQFIP